jgi:uncharacterized protein (TIGR02246 family)
LLFGTFCASLCSAGTVHAADKEAIVATWSELDAAWVARDVDRISRLFAEDATFTFLPGARRLEGGPAIRAHFAAQFPRQSPELRHVTDVQRVRLLTEGLAAVDAGVRVLRSGREGASDTLFRAFAIFAIMTRIDDGWEILEIRAFRLPEETVREQSLADPSAARCIDRAAAEEMVKALLGGGALLSTHRAWTPEERRVLELLNPFTRPPFCPGVLSDRVAFAGPAAVTE